MSGIGRWIIRHAGNALQPDIVWRQFVGRAIQFILNSLCHLRRWPVSTEPLVALGTEKIHAVQDSFVARQGETARGIHGGSMVAGQAAGGHWRMRLTGEKLVLEICD